jgi:hypothetical protein
VAEIAGLIFGKALARCRFSSKKMKALSTSGALSDQRAQWLTLCRSGQAGDEEFVMSVLKKVVLASLTTALLGTGVVAQAQVLFSDDFEDRVRDQAVIGNNWTWYDQGWSGDECSNEVDPSSGFGPFDDGNGNDYEAANRNYWTADVANGGDGNYFRAGLEVPAWEGAYSNMLRVYGNVYVTSQNCNRVLIFQEINPIVQSGVFEFSYDVVKDVAGDLENGSARAGFVKVLDPSNGYETVLFKVVDSDPPVAGPARRAIQFEIPEAYQGMILQYGFYNDWTPNLGQTWDKSGAYYDNVKLENLIIGPAHSGSWYNANQDGHGFSVEFTELGGIPIAVVYWYTYDALGLPIFLVGTGLPVGNRLEVTFESPVGMVFGDFDPTTVTRLEGGTGVFVFKDRDNATFSYTPAADMGSQHGINEGIDNLPLVKLLGIPADSTFENPAYE